MAKYCSGCGILLQDKDKNKDGYTPDQENELCMRCFRLKNYGENKETNLSLSNKGLIKKINDKGYFVIFLIDFLNIYQEVIDIYKKIKSPKMLVITKEDLIPKNIVKSKLKNNIARVYGIKEEIIFVSSKTKNNLNLLNNVVKKNKNVIMAGLSNAGKSSLINALMDSKLTISKNANTTLDFININGIYDTPGFLSCGINENVLPKKKVRPISFQLKSKYYLTFNNYKLSCNINNNLVFYMSNNIIIEKRRKEEVFGNMININANSNLIIKGIGFVLIKMPCIIDTDIPMDLLEVRASIVGDNNE